MSFSYAQPLPQVTSTNIHIKLWVACRW